MYDHDMARAYIWYLSRPDRKYNFYFAPFIDLSQIDQKRKPFSDYYSDDYQCYYTCYINGREIIFDERKKRAFVLSLKPGNYKIKLTVYIKHALGKAFEKDKNFKASMFSPVLRHKMSSPYWTERKIEKTYDIRMSEYNTVCIGFNGYLNGEFIGHYNEDYYHVKYNEYEEVIYTLVRTREDFGFFESKVDEIERIFNFEFAGKKFDYDDIKLNAKNHILLEMGEYPFNKKTVEPKIVSSTTQTVKPASTTTKVTPIPAVSKIPEVTQTNTIKENEVCIRKESDRIIYYGGINNYMKFGFGMEYDPKNNTLFIGDFDGGYRSGYGILVNLNDQSTIIGSFIGTRVKENKLSVPSIGYSMFFENNNSLKHLNLANGVYYGQVNSKNEPEGFGKLLYKDGTYYIGEWVFGKQNGLGVYRKKIGYQIGMFMMGELNGYGIEALPSGRTIQGIFSNGRLW